MTTKTPAYKPMTVEDVRTKVCRKIAAAIGTVTDGTDPNDIAGRLSSMTDSDSFKMCMKMADCWEIVRSYHLHPNPPAYIQPDRSIMKSGNLPLIIHAVAVKIVTAVWAEEVIRYVNEKAEAVS